MCPRHWGNYSIYWVRYLHAAMLPYPNGMQTTWTQWTVKDNLFTFFEYVLFYVTDQLSVPIQALTPIQPTPETSLSLLQPYRARKERVTNQFNLGFPLEEKALLGYVGLTSFPFCSLWHEWVYRPRAGLTGHMATPLCVTSIEVQQIF